VACSFIQAGSHGRENLYRESGRRSSAYANKGLAVPKGNHAQSKGNVSIPVMVLIVQEKCEREYGGRAIVDLMQGVRSASNLFVNEERRHGLAHPKVTRPGGRLTLHSHCGKRGSAVGVELGV
jgi:hypothetical protein